MDVSTFPPPSQHIYAWVLPRAGESSVPRWEDATPEGLQVSKCFHCANRSYFLPSTSLTVHYKIGVVISIYT